MSADDEGLIQTKDENVHDGSRMGAPEHPPLQTGFDRIVLERIDPKLFLAKPEHLWKPPGARAVFGGQVLGQALSAASQTVGPQLSLHSLHAYFVRPGQLEHPLLYDVKRIRDGSSFATRAVGAKQNGQGILTMIASFHRREYASLDNQALMPSVPSPETLPTEEQRWQNILSDPSMDPIVKQMLKQGMNAILRSRQQSPFDLRFIVDHLNWSSEEAKQILAKNNFSSMGMPSQLMWFRARNRLPDDEHVHHAVVAYQSDAGLLATARVGVPPSTFNEARPMMASLDHAMWFHQPFPSWRADEWLLYVMYSPRLSGARGLAHGHIFTQDGRLVVSCSQEGLIRLGTDRDSPPASKL